MPISSGCRIRAHTCPARPRSDRMPGVLPYRSVLVTGAGGFVGRHLLPVLRDRLASDAQLVAPPAARPARTRGLT